MTEEIKKDLKEYSGSCHCGAVTYKAKVDTSNGMMCNCSYCSRQGYILSFIPDTDFTLLTGEDSLTEYKFNKHVISHPFCRVCGIQCHAQATHEGMPTIAVNLRTIEGFDPNTCTIKHVDGKSF